MQYTNRPKKHRKHRYVYTNPTEQMHTQNIRYAEALKQTRPPIRMAQTTSKTCQFMLLLHYSANISYKSWVYYRTYIAQIDSKCVREERKTHTEVTWTL